MWVLWLIIIILLTILEVVTINLVSVWFIASGLISLLLSFFIESFYIQFAIFVSLGLILMLIVTEEITKFKIGEVKVDGKRWSAISDEKILNGSHVIVEGIEGVKLIVRKGEE